MASRWAHKLFMHMLVDEAYRFHGAPTAASTLAWLNQCHRIVHSQMCVDDDCDHYAEVLIELAHERLFDR